MSFMDRALGALGLGARANVEVGQPAPGFILKDTEGREVSLGTLLAGGPVILAFFPKAFTGGCTRELRSYSEQYDLLVDRGARLIAISMDDPATLARFRDSLGARFTFLSDPDGAVSRLYGGVSLGTSNRITVTVGEDGLVKRVTSGLHALFPGADIAACPVAQQTNVR